MELSVPVIVDDVKRIDGFEMTRCVYFQIECDDSLTPWTLGLGNVRVPFLMIGLAGIILSPVGEQREFLMPQDFDDLLNSIENRNRAPGEAELSVELADIWIPNWILEKHREGIERGDVCRVGHKLFRLAFAFRSGRTEREEFERHTRNLIREVVFSERETYVFRDWAKMEIGRARESVNRGLWLPRKAENRE